MTATKTKAKTVTATKMDSTQDQCLERLFAMSTRLANAVAEDITALETGDMSGLATLDPEIEKLAARYGKEVAAVKAAGGFKDASPALTAQVKQSVARLKLLLARHQILVDAMRHTSEGLVQAVAEEVEKSRRRIAPYAAKPAARPASSGPIIYNKTV